jgi:hypothetical protein
MRREVINARFLPSYLTRNSAFWRNLTLDSVVNGAAKGGPVLGIRRWFAAILMRMRIINLAF